MVVAGIVAAKSKRVVRYVRCNGRLLVVLEASLRLSVCSEIVKELIDEITRIRQRKEMAARKLINTHVQSFARDTPLEVDRKESIVTSRDYVDRHLGPRFESTGLAEDDVGLGALARFTSLDDLGRNVVQEGDVLLKAAGRPTEQERSKLLSDTVPARRILSRFVVGESAKAQAPAARVVSEACGKFERVLRSLRSSLLRNAEFSGLGRAARAHGPLERRLGPSLLSDNCWP